MMGVALLKEQKVDALGQAGVPEMLSDKSFRTSLVGIG
jgi:hypothetical protein